MSLDVQAYHRAVEIRHMRRLMLYDQAAYEEDWNVALALAQLMAVGGKEHFQRVLDDCFQRLIAYRCNNPYVLPFGKESK